MACKTLQNSVQAFAAHIEAVLINITASTLFSKYVGDSNRLTSAIFTLAAKIAQHGRTVVVFIDEVDALLGDGADFEHEHTMQVRPSRPALAPLSTCVHAKSRGRAVCSEDVNASAPCIDRWLQGAM